MFYNTGIATYIWVVSKSKPEKHPNIVKLIDASKCFEKRRKSLGNKRNEFTKECIDLIVKAYLSAEEGVFENNGKTVERKDFDRFTFKYSKVTVERPLCDENGAPVLKKGKPQPDASKRDTEIIPWGIDFAEYMQRNVLPCAPDGIFEVLILQFNPYFLHSIFTASIALESFIIGESVISFIAFSTSMGISR